MAYETIIEDGIDVLVVGAGLGGSGAAWEARFWGQNKKIVIAEKANIDRSGAVAQGLGLGTSEGFAWSDGRPQNPNFGDYKLPTVGDMPKIHLAFADSYEPTGPFGAKGVGEIALDAVPAAIANAVHNAVGVRITELPITAEKVYRALREREAHS